MTFKLAIVGRPNVGKSTLFNRLVGKKLALVDDQPGVTRDLREGDARLGHLKFTAVDTAGLETATDNSLQGRMRRLSEAAVQSCDMSLFMIDARVGITPVDREFSDLLRRSGKPVIVAANKAEGMAAASGIIDAYSLGLGDPVPVSAEHGEGMADLAAVLMPIIEDFEEMALADSPETDVDLEEGVERIMPQRPLQIAVVGRPNAGKSTLVNQIYGENRLLTGPEGGDHTRCNCVKFSVE